MHTLLLILARQKEFLITTLVILGSLFFLGSIEGGSGLSPQVQGAIVATAVFLVIPLLYCRIVLERPLSALGFQRGNPWAGIGGSVLALGLALTALFVLWNFTPLLEDYRLPVAVREQFLFFVLYQVVLNGFFLFLFEVFFRGMVMLLWLRELRIWGVFIQAILFTGILFLSGDVTAHTIPLILIAPFAGLVAYQSRSLWYSFGVSWFFVLMVDSLILIVR